ncbi:MAG TPA: hypothetical protein VLE95_03455 [Chlamydiales bacterium]|nr:hypothetical protein [Chlamydiales bacterium]
MIRIFFVAFLAACLSFFGVSVQDRLSIASNGDYLVMEGGKMITLLSIRSINPTSFVLEEVSAPVENLQTRPSSWHEWIKGKAPGHTSWSMFEIQRSNGEILECYSFTRGAWIQLSTKESLIATLLSLSLTPVSHENRRKIGPPPSQGEMDNRKIWSPPALFEGKKQEGMQFDVYETVWPKDQTPFSGNTVLLYFDKEGRFPFPFWIQVEASHANLALRTIDTGKHCPSPYRKFPRRIPQFIGDPKKTQKGLKLFLKSPKYFQNFNLFAIDVTTKERELCPISYSLIQGKDELLTLEIEEEDLNQVLTTDHCYIWLLVPIGHADSYTETIKPFAWHPL